MGVSDEFREFVRESLKGSYDWEGSSSNSFSKDIGSDILELTCEVMEKLGRTVAPKDKNSRTYIKGFIRVIEQSVTRIKKEEDRESLVTRVIKEVK